MKPRYNAYIGVQRLFIRRNASHSGRPVNPSEANVAILIESYVQDCFIRGLVMEGFPSGVSILADARRVTVADCSFRSGKAQFPELI